MMIGFGELCLVAAIFGNDGVILSDEVQDVECWSGASVEDILTCDALTYLDRLPDGRPVISWCEADGRLVSIPETSQASVAE